MRFYHYFLVGLTMWQAVVVKSLTGPGGNN
jgi:hypothetical protein